MLDSLNHITQAFYVVVSMKMMRKISAVQSGPDQPQ